MTLNKIQQGQNTFCGPAVISAICGISTDEAAKVIQGVTKQTRPVKAVWDTDLSEAFKRLGYNVRYLQAGGSLYYMLSILKTGVYVLVVPGHFICIEIDSDGKRYICDNHTRKPLNASASARLGQKVMRVIKVEKRECTE